MAKKRPRKRLAKKRPKKSADPLAAAVDELRESLARLRDQQKLGDDLVSDLRQADAVLSPIRDVIAEHLKAVLRVAHVEKRPPLAKGRNIARQVNDVLANYGLRLRFPGTGLPATLAYTQIGRAKPAAYVLRTTAGGKPRTHYLATDFSDLDVITAPPDRRRLRKRSSRK